MGHTFPSYVRPQENATDYFNHKEYHSLVMQAVVDFQSIFADVYIGWPGRVHDARIFFKFRHLQERIKWATFQNQTRPINGHKLPIVIVGDPAYSLLSWLMKPGVRRDAARNDDILISGSARQEFGHLTMEHHLAN